MSKPFRTNEVPVAHFNLRTAGPLPFTELVTSLGGRYFRVATGSDEDKRATVDKDPCPHCGSAVEWVQTAKAEPDGSSVVRYVYARCRGAETHRWGFRNRADSVPLPPAPTPRNPFTGKMTMRHWIDGQLLNLKAEVEKLEHLRELAGSMQLPNPHISA